MDHLSLDGRLTGLAPTRVSSILAEEDLLPAHHSTSVVNLLLQALESSDQSLLDWCLERTTEKAIPASIVSLPPARAEQLLVELSNRFLTFHQSAAVVLAWLQPLLSIHRSSLSSESVNALIRTLQIRTEKFGLIGDLRAKLHYMTQGREMQDGVRIVTDRVVTYTEDPEEVTMESEN